jgi:uncharacterized protein
MTTAIHPGKQLMQAIFNGLAVGDSKPFLDSLHEDFSWTATGSNSWSGVYRGRKTVREQLLRPLFSNFATQYTNTAHRFIAEGDWVVVECQGKVITKSGQPYNNRYCWVCRVEGGKLLEVIEYMDTELVATALAPRT